MPTSLNSVPLAVGYVELSPQHTARVSFDVSGENVLIILATATTKATCVTTQTFSCLKGASMVVLDLSLFALALKSFMIGQKHRVGVFKYREQTERYPIQQGFSQLRGLEQRKFSGIWCKSNLNLVNNL